MILLNRQEGTALVGVIMVLFILTFLGTTAFLSSTTELKISSNYTQSLRALYAAEAGLQELLTVFRRNPEVFLQKKSGTELSFPVVEPDRPNGPEIKFWLMSLRYDPGNFPSYAEVIMAGKDLGQNAQCRIRATIFCAAAGGLDAVPSVFKVGMVSAGTLRLEDPLAIQSSIHANQGYQIDPISWVAHLQDQQFSVTQSLEPGRPDYLDPMEIPVLSNQGFREYQLKAQNPGNQILSGFQELTLKGDQNGRLIYVDGDVTLTGEAVSGLMVVATGSITLNGSVVLKEDATVNTAFFAGGDIIMDHFSQLSGVFWSNGSLIKRGAGKISGSLVCQGPVDFGGGFQFDRITQISDVYFCLNPTRYSFVVKGWSQM